MVESQTDNLTPDPSFAHNLCFRCANEQCDPILDIYTPRAFQWYKELFQPWSFDPWNRLLKIWESTGTPTPKVELPWECEGSFPLTLLHSREHAEWLPGSSWPATLQPPCLGRKPKAKVTTFVHFVFSLWVYFKFTLAFPHWLFVFYLCSHKIMYKISQEELGLRKNQLRIFIDFILMACYH